MLNNREKAQEECMRSGHDWRPVKDSSYQMCSRCHIWEEDYFEDWMDLFWNGFGEEDE